MIRVALVEDNDTIRLGLAILLMDIGLPGMSGIEGLRRAKALRKGII